MEEDALEKECARLVREVHMLVKLYVQQKNQLSVLLEENKVLKARLAESESVQTDFQKKQNVRIIGDQAFINKQKQSTVKTNKDMSSALRALEGYIACVDRCISYLSQV